MAQEFGTTCIETSAKQRINVDEAFAELVRNIRKYTDVRPCSPHCCVITLAPRLLALALISSRRASQESSAKPVGAKDSGAAASSGGGGHVPLKTDSHDGGCCGGCVIL